MSRIRADKYTNRAADGAPTFSDGVNVVGITSVNPGTGTTSMLVTGDLSVINGTLKGASQLSISGITSSISDTAVDVLVYDTSKDSDGGEWRKRTQNTSWYNETLNTATRGSRREFPSVAVIVAEDAKLTIYDGDDPDLPMWMVFNLLGAVGNPNSNMLPRGGPGTESDITSIVCLNGKLAVGLKDVSGTVGEGLAVIDFISELARIHRTEGSGYTGAFYNSPISGRNSNGEYNGDYNSLAIVAETCNDVAITVLPNAPIDDTTGLPVPTIAVATDGGVSVIKDDGNVVDITSSKAVNDVDLIHFDKSGRLYFAAQASSSITDVYQFNRYVIPGADISNNVYEDNAAATYFSYATSGSFANERPNINARYNDGTNEDITNIISNNDGGIVGNVNGLSLFAEDYSSQNGGMVAYAATSYNTGWMHGDIQGAYLSDTDTTSLDGTEFITNGTFTSDTTGWGAGNGATLTQQSNGNPGGNINVASGPSSNGYASQIHTVVVGEYYTLRFDHYHVDGSQGYVNIGTSLGGSEYVYNELGTSSSWTTFQFTIKATSTQLFTGFYSRPNGNVRYDNISLKEADPDRSLNNKGLRTSGTITKSVVATGADLVGYSGFSASNTLGNTNDYDFGVGTSISMSIMGWFKTTDISTYTYIMSVYDSSSDHVAGLAINSSASSAPHPAGTLYLYDSITSQTSGFQTVNDGKWHCAVGIFDGPIRKIYLDGELQVQTEYTSYALDIADTNKLTVGRYAYNDTFHFGGSLALARISKSLPSEEQIKKMYHDEKVLFQENAQATLYGSSDAVTAFGYDENDDTLHVGTSSGRSEFQGLQRINNTTTAVTTAISASNELVAEQ